jgi:four helix bundle protein
MDRFDERTYRFSLRILKLVSALPKTETGKILGMQELRSGSSIGTNVEEANGAISKREFIQKMSIAAKESRETHYWLRLIRDAELLSSTLIEPLIQESLEIKIVLSKSVKTSKARYISNKATNNSQLHLRFHLSALICALSVASCYLSVVSCSGEAPWVALSASSSCLQG